MKNSLRTKHVSLLTWKYLLPFALAGAAALFFIWSVAKIDNEDVQEYRQLMAISESGTESTQPYQAKQQRWDVQKDILFNQGGARLQMRLKAADAQLLLDKQESDSAIMEQMNDVQCCMQEELFFTRADGTEALQQADGRLLIRHADPKLEASWIEKDAPGLMPMQIIRYMEAEHAIYHYKTDLFVAEKVTLYRYLVPGHQFTETVSGLKPMMSGVAQKVEFALGEQEPKFKAYQMKATFYNSGKAK